MQQHKNSEAALTCTSVSKGFKLPHERNKGVKQALINLAKRRNGYENQHVLNDVSFEIKKGEFFGIVGRNGSGKSTLLKLLAGIYVPDKGSVAVHGSLVPFIELGVGFNPELTGRENVFLNGALLGFSRTDVEAIYDDIVEFAELGRFMDQKLKNYSSGMQVRLAFSIAIRARQDILLVDEVLAVGDARFQTKCYKTFRELKEEGRTIVFVTHDMSAVERFCDRVLVLNKGEVEGVFTPKDAASRYEEMNAATSGTVSSGLKRARRWGTGDVRLKSLSVNGKLVRSKPPVVKQGEPLSLSFAFDNQEGAKDIVMGLAIHDSFGTNMSGPNSLEVPLSSGKPITFTTDTLAFNPGVYSLSVVVFDKNAEAEYDHQEEVTSFTVVTDDHQQLHGKINLFGKWKQ